MHVQFALFQDNLAGRDLLSKKNSPEAMHAYSTLINFYCRKIAEADVQGLDLPYMP